MSRLPGAPESWLHVPLGEKGASFQPVLLLRAPSISRGPAAVNSQGLWASVVWTGSASSSPREGGAKWDGAGRRNGVGGGRRGGWLGGVGVAGGRGLGGRATGESRAGGLGGAVLGWAGLCWVGPLEEGGAIPLLWEEPGAVPSSSWCWTRCQLEKLWLDWSGAGGFACGTKLKAKGAGGEA